MSHEEAVDVLAVGMSAGIELLVDRDSTQLFVVEQYANATPGASQNCDGGSYAIGLSRRLPKVFWK